MSPETPASAIQVIDRAVALIDALAREPGPASLKILSAETGLHPSTAHRILAALSEHGLIDRDSANLYRLGPRLLEWSGRVSAGQDLRQIARPVMEWLRDQVGESVNLTLREGDQVVYVERAIPNRMMRVEQVIGSRAPLHVTAVGKLMLGEAGADATKEYARRTGLRAYTVNTRAKAGTLQKDIDTSRARGYALDDEEAELGVGCIGVLIRDASGAAVAGLSVSAPMERRQTAWIPLVQEAGRRISARLGYQPPAA
ncbi:MAG: IclR family transcriptional regulator [Parasulfuritortus sp.]|nr:IclR family transcriptional regulator [Parasulfuritortus sp.]